MIPIVESPSLDSRRAGWGHDGLRSMKRVSKVPRFHLFGGSTAEQGLLGDQKPWGRSVVAAGIRSGRSLAGYSLSCPWI